MLSKRPFIRRKIISIIFCDVRVSRAWYDAYKISARLVVSGLELYARTSYALAFDIDEISRKNLYGYRRAFCYVHTRWKRSGDDEGKAISTGTGKKGAKVPISPTSCPVVADDNFNRIKPVAGPAPLVV